jgi:glucose/arabinose dehydrogenase
MRRHLSFLIAIVASLPSAADVAGGPLCPQPPFSVGECTVDRTTLREADLDGDGEPDNSGEPGSFCGGNSPATCGTPPGAEVGFDLIVTDPLVQSVTCSAPGVDVWIMSPDCSECFVIGFGSATLPAGSTVGSELKVVLSDHDGDVCVCGSPLVCTFDVEAECFDGVDGDGDGLIDAADPDCCAAAPLSAFGSSGTFDCTGVSDVSDFDGPTVGDLDGRLTAVPVALGLTRPVYVTSPPGDTQRLFIVLQDGTIRLVKNGTLLTTPFLSIDSLVRSPADAGGGVEEGLLGLAFDPSYATNGRFYVYYTVSTGQANAVWRYTVSAHPDVANAASGQQVLSIPHTSFSNHNGGQLAFGPSDGRLYVGVGDGGGSCDPSGAAQNLNSLLGKILRLDVSTLPFGTTGNPFHGAVPGNDAIWHYGLRNPWRFSFDRATSAMYVGDVGQNWWEEIDCTPAASGGGVNFGWDFYEGDHCPNPSCGGSCPGGSFEPPILEYPHIGSSCSVTGGHVYRGCRAGDLHGTYFYADYCSEFIRSFRTGPEAATLTTGSPCEGVCSATEHLDRTVDLDPTGSLDVNSIVSFGEDARGELFIVDGSGSVFQIQPDFDLFEVSGQGAPMFLLGDDWQWENLRQSSYYLIGSYRIYRSDTGPTGPFRCVRQSTTTTWIGGDPVDPPAGQVRFYLVTARDFEGRETRPGQRSDGTPRTVDTASSCP